MDEKIPAEYIKRCLDYLEENDRGLNEENQEEDEDEDEEEDEDEDEDEEEEEEEDEEEVRNRKIVQMAHAIHHHNTCDCNDPTSEYLSEDIIDYGVWYGKQDDDYYYGWTLYTCNDMIVSKWTEPCCHKRYRLAIPKTVLEYGKGFSLDSTDCQCSIVENS